MIELEKTFLLKDLPLGLKECKSKEVIDIYIPSTRVHPDLRIRKNGDRHEMTKKQPVQDGDASHQLEQTIKLTKEEFTELSQLEGKRVRKTRYYYNHTGRMAEIDVFQDGLKGLVLADFEFDLPEEKDNFEMPDFCLADVTHEVFIAGGMLCGKSYSDITDSLKQFNYTPLYA